MKSAAIVARERPAPPTERETREYDRFGPWTYPVRSQDEMPPRFDPWYEEFKTAELVLKLPVPVERRMARPGSDLYEALLAVGGSGVAYLALSEGRVLRRDLAFERIAAIRLSEDLLLGHFSLDLVDGDSVSIAFNTVSADAFEDFADAVRRRTCQPSAAGRRFAFPEPAAAPAQEDMLFQNLLRALRARAPGFGLAAYQPPALLEPRRDGGRRGLVGLVARLLRWRLDGCLLAFNPGELALVLRGSGSPRVRKPAGYRFEHIFLPGARFVRATVEARRAANGASVFALRISQEGRDYELVFARDPACLLPFLA